MNKRLLYYKADDIFDIRINLLQIGYTQVDMINYKRVFPSYCVLYPSFTFLWLLSLVWT